VLAASIIRLIALMMEAASISKTSVNFYQTTRYNNPEDSHLRIYVLFIEDSNPGHSLPELKAYTGNEDILRRHELWGRPS
jgi:hypothetical protein